MRALDLSGRAFGRLHVLRFSHSAYGKRMWLCLCDCGKEKLASASGLNSGDAVSCGASGCSDGKRLRHGHNRRGRATPEYEAWTAMIKRCCTPSHQAFHNYGGRGISVCARWRESYAAFFADMGARPSPKHSLDRINNDGNYEKTNCRWATALEQRHNQRRSKQHATASAAE